MIEYNRGKYQIAQGDAVFTQNVEKPKLDFHKLVLMHFSSNIIQQNFENRNKHYLNKNTKLNF